jgi:hypothetical protein
MQDVAAPRPVGTRLCPSGQRGKQATLVGGARRSLSCGRRSSSDPTAAEQGAEEATLSSIRVLGAPRNTVVAATSCGSCWTPGTTTHSGRVGRSHRRQNRCVAAGTICPTEAGGVRPQRFTAPRPDGGSATLREDANPGVWGETRLAREAGGFDRAPPDYRRPFSGVYPPWDRRASPPRLPTRGPVCVRVGEWTAGARRGTFSGEGSRGSLAAARKRPG